ncbi:MAG: hypothetical protein MRERC_3c068 [Mycoplasmataceae bacterium RC_NB112A]|nr:MAG: hypothetical protein MRERC_3c068 [Mycoplasmataceae bacterium RC_NB112A]
MVSSSLIFNITFDIFYYLLYIFIYLLSIFFIGEGNRILTHNPGFGGRCFD